MDEKDKVEKREDEDTEGNMPFAHGVKPEGTEDAEGQRRKSLTPEGTEEKDAEGHSRRP
jgi:hypothetical protein